MSDFEKTQRAVNIAHENFVKAAGFENNEAIETLYPYLENYRGVTGLSRIAIDSIDVLLAKIRKGDSEYFAIIDRVGMTRMRVDLTVGGATTATVESMFNDFSEKLNQLNERLKGQSVEGGGEQKIDDNSAEIIQTNISNRVFQLGRLVALAEQLAAETVLHRQRVFSDFCKKYLSTSKAAVALKSLDGEDIMEILAQPIMAFLDPLGIWAAYQDAHKKVELKMQTVAGFELGDTDRILMLQETINDELTLSAQLMKILDLIDCQIEAIENLPDFERE